MQNRFPMTDTFPPYRFDPQGLPTILSDNIVEESVFTFRGEKYPYGLIAQGAIPKVPYFNGMQGGQNLFVADSVPANCRHVWLEHEILCNRSLADIAGRCESIERNLMEGIGSDVLQMRFKMFEALISFNKINVAKLSEATPQNREIAGTYRYLQTRVDESSEED